MCVCHHLNVCISSLNPSLTLSCVAPYAKLSCTHTHTHAHTPSGSVCVACQYEGCIPTHKMCFWAGRVPSGHGYVSLCVCVCVCVSVCVCVCVCVAYLETWQRSHSIWYHHIRRIVIYVPV